MRIGIDCRLSGNTHAGIGRYIENLIIRLPQLSADITWVFFFHDSQQLPLSLLKVPNVEVHYAPIRHYTLAEQLRLPQLFSKAHLDLLHVPHFNIPLAYRGQLMVTIHDLLWHEHKGVQVTTLNPLVYWFKYIAYQIIANEAVKKATTILVPAETVKNTLVRYYPQAKNKIIVTKEGVSGEFQLKRNHTHTATTKQLIYVGSLYPHKNISLVLRALKALPEYHLNIVGSRNVFQEQVKEQVNNLGITSQVTFHGFVPDAQLTRLLSNATALVQPSLSEGFGLTGVEAMAAGVPVLASDIPIFKEVYQDGALYFDPHSPASFQKAVKRLETMKSDEVSRQGQRVAKHYSWDTMAKETLAQYLKILQ